MRLQLRFIYLFIYFWPIHGQSLQHHLLQGLFFFSPLNFFASLSNLVGHTGVGPPLGCLFCCTGLCVYPSTNTSVLITVVIFVSLKSRRVILALYFSFQKENSIFSSFAHKFQNIIYSIKKSCGDLKSFVKHVYQFGENRYLYCVKSSKP